MAVGVSGTSAYLCAAPSDLAFSAEEVGRGVMAGTALVTEDEAAEYALDNYLDRYPVRLDRRSHRPVAKLGSPEVWESFP